MSEKTEVIKALFAARKEFPKLQKDGRNPHFQSEFVTLDNILNTIQPILWKHGLLISQPSFYSQDGAGVSTLVIHEASGQEMELGHVVVPVNKKDAQGYGSAITYGRRYALQTGLCLTTGEDDDGNAAASAKPDDEMSVKTRIAGIAKGYGIAGGEDMKTLVQLVRRKINAPDTLVGWQDVEAFMRDSGKDAMLALLNGSGDDKFVDDISQLMDEQAKPKGRK